jgi:hypothetical protein
VKLHLMYVRSLFTYQNYGTRLLSTTKCQCSCLCPLTLTGDLCQIPIVPINRTYPAQIVIAINRLEGRKENKEKIEKQSIL